MHQRFGNHLYYPIPSTNFSFYHLLISDTFWIAIGSIVAFLVLMYAILKDRFDKYESVGNIKKALYFELLTNISLLFSGEVEREPIFDVIKIVRTKFAKHIKNQELFLQFQKLYAELDYYQIIINQYWLRLDQRHPGMVETKQLSTINKFIEFFGEQGIQRDTLNETSAQARKRAIDLKDKKIDEWKIILKQNIDKLFK